jgi:hypothetical protein
MTMRTHMRFVSSSVCSCVLALAAFACSGNKPEPGVDTAAPAQQTQQQQTVPTVVSVVCMIHKSPSQLHVTANGEVPTGGWTSPALRRRTYVAAPADSIWEYDFFATPPAGMATQVITPISAEDTWADYPAQSLAGLRVYGEGSGTKELRLTQCTTQ